MADRLKRGLARLTDRLQAHASEPVTYARGDDSVDLRATLGSQLLKLQTDDGVVLERTDLDFFIPAADLVLSGVAVTPERGDTLTITLGGVAQTYEVDPYGAGESCWRWSDPHQSMMRVRTKRTT